MLVKDIFVREVKTCSPDSDLARCVSLMWDGDCGVIPVVDQSNKLLGAITDRDIAMALGTRNVPASQVRSSEVMSKQVHSCRVQDDVRAALRTMAQQRIRRLPVVQNGGTLAGILSINDIILATEEAEDLREDVLSTLRAICAPSKRRPVTAGAGRSR